MSYFYSVDALQSNYNTSGNMGKYSNSESLLLDQTKHSTIKSFTEFVQLWGQGQLFLHLQGHIEMWLCQIFLSLLTTSKWSPTIGAQAICTECKAAQMCACMLNHKDSVQKGYYLSIKLFTNHLRKHLLKQSLCLNTFAEKKKKE